MSPADLSKDGGFGASCCEGPAGTCQLTADSCQSCGCDPGCKPEPHYCERHRLLIELKELYGETS